MEVVWRILSCCCSVGETEALAEEGPLGEWMQRPAEPGVCRGAVSTPERSPLPKPGSWGAEVVSEEGRRRPAPEQRKKSQPRACRAWQWAIGFARGLADGEPAGASAPRAPGAALEGRAEQGRGLASPSCPVARPRAAHSA